ncbi:MULTISPECIES: nitroreductase/quinone reductase family protein [unclassified Streptomyces]|uniref:nitroreductase/quinone reductase family protein n=1 Tax=unclassified Streptomyces TaxID=2593676 RepID=UPI0004C36FD8
MSTPAAAPHVVKPGWFTVNVVNRSVAWLTRRGISVWGSRILAVKGRTSGVWRTTPVNVLTLDGERYLVAPRGHVQWTRNMRAVGGGELRLGTHVEPFTATEVGDDAKAEVLRAYLKRWKAEVGVFFAGVGPDSTDAELRAIAPKHPVFRITAAPDA